MLIHQRMKLPIIVGLKIINFSWNEKKIIDQEKGWIARKIKETIHSIKNDKHINSTSYNLADIWLPAVRKDS